MLTSLLPDTLPLSYAAFLAVCAFFTSGLTAALGLGGGVALLAIMASIMPVSALIPLHGVVQMGSNVSRMIIQIRHLDAKILIWFGIGSLIGALIGGHFVVSLPDTILKIGLAAFILWTVWGKKPRFNKLPKSLLALGGLVATFLTMFFGATGPVVAGLISSLVPDRRIYSATHAACMSLQHLLKVIVFGFLGFSFAPWLPLLIAMLIASFLGSFAGSRLLGRMREETFRLGFKIVMTLLAANLLWRAIETVIATGDRA